METTVVSQSTQTDRCKVGECAKFNEWQEDLWLKGTHSSSSIYERSQDTVSDCSAVHGCLFEQTVEISGVREDA